MSGVIDPTISANYPVVLGDGLLGKNSNEIFTGIKYNHRVNQHPPTNARLKPSLPGSTSSFDLAYTEDGKNYAYEGTRNIGDHQYVLYFHPERKVFILDKIDSTFNMNLTRIPGNSDPASLRKMYPNIGSEINSAMDTHVPTSSSNLTSKEAKKAAATSHRKSPLMPPKKKFEKKASKSTGLVLPEPTKPKPKPAKKKKNDYEDDEEEEDDDGGLLIEYPDAPDPKSRATDFSPAFPSVRRFDEFMDARESEGDDADGESEDEVEDLRLPSPVNNARATDEAEAQEDEDPMEVDQAERSQDGLDEEDMEADLEKELANAFEDYENSNQGTPADNEGNAMHGTPAGGGDDESEISEED